MTKAKASYSDLKKRVVTAVVLIALVAAALSIGRWGTLLLMSLLGAAITWEVAGLRKLSSPLLWAAVFAVAAVATGAFPCEWWAWGAVILILGAGLWRDGLFGLLMAAVLMTTNSYVLAYGFDVRLFVWIVFTVILTDVAGYFCGKNFGGPLVWPRLSPKKTWSGVLGGWAAAMVFALMADPLPLPIWGHFCAALAISIAAQVGDFTESALKRHSDAKDSSTLLPGHGGVFDRCDGFVGVGVLLAPAIIWLAFTSSKGFLCG